MTFLSDRKFMCYQLHANLQLDPYIADRFTIIGHILFSLACLLGSVVNEGTKFSENYL